jgi:peptidyl-prolyl cis-trans isomerase A (cyclophilin A)
VITPRRPLFVALASALVLSGCDKAPPPADSTAATAAQTTPAAPADPAAPDSFKVAFVTGKGQFVVQVNRALAPHGADHFHALVQDGFYDKAKFFRVIPGFMAQFGISGDPAANRKWDRSIADDPVKESNRKGALTFAMTSQPNSRSTQLFINLVDNPRLDASGFAPFGRVISGMDVVEKLYGGYGEGAPEGNGPEQGRIERDGNAYLNSGFPRLDSIVTARIVK